MKVRLYWYNGKNVQQLLQKKLGEDYRVELAMRYQFPSIAQALNSFHQKGIKQIQVLSLFPQEAQATTGSIRKEIETKAAKFHFKWNL